MAITTQQQSDAEELKKKEREAVEQRTAQEEARKVREEREAHFNRWGFYPVGVPGKPSDKPASIIQAPKPSTSIVQAPTASAPVATVSAPKPPVAQLVPPAGSVSGTDQRFAKASGVSQNLVAQALAPDVLTKFTPATPTPSPVAAPPIVAAPKPTASMVPPVELGSISGGTLIRTPAQEAPILPDADKPSIDAQIAKLMSPYQGNTGIIPSAVSQKLLELERQKTKSTPESRAMAEELDRSRGAALADKAVASMDERRALEQRARVAGVKPDIQFASEKATKDEEAKRAAAQKAIETEASAKVAASRGAGADAAATEAESRKAVAQINADVAKANSLADLEKLTMAAELDANSPLNKAQVEAIKAKTAHLPEEDRLEMMKVQLQLAAFQNQQQKEAAAAAIKAQESQADIEHKQAQTQASGQNAIEKARENALAAAGFSKQTDPETKASRWYKGNVLVEPDSPLDRELSGIQARFGAAPAVATPAPATASGRPRSASGKFEWDGKSWVPVS